MNSNLARAMLLVSDTRDECEAAGRLSSARMLGEIMHAIIRADAATTLPAACPVCGGKLLGDGFRQVIHCEHVGDVERIWETEPDGAPVFCDKISG